jgi:hypothetical protein
MLNVGQQKGIPSMKYGFFTPLKDLLIICKECLALVYLCIVTAGRFESL